MYSYIKHNIEFIQSSSSRRFTKCLSLHYVILYQIKPLNIKQYVFILYLLYSYKNNIFTCLLYLMASLLLLACTGSYGSSAFKSVSAEVKRNIISDVDLFCKLSPLITSPGHQKMKWNYRRSRLRILPQVRVIW